MHISKHIHLIGFLFYVLLCFLLHPYYGYILDADAVGYLSIAERVAKGDWYRSINGLWSPLNSWLLVPFIQSGFNAFMVAKALNFLLGGMVYFLSLSLLMPLVKSNFYKTLVSIALPIVLVYYVYLQIFADILQLVFVLVFVHLYIRNKYFESTKLQVAAALTLAIAYYAKAYSLPFYLFVQVFSIILIYCRPFLLQHTQIDIQLGLKPSYTKLLLALFVFMLAIIPWIYQLHTKYQMLSLTGNAGKLNMSWNLIAAKEYNDSIKILIPPTYTNSVSFWEDPYPSQAKLHTPFESAKMFIHWVFRIGHTALNTINCLNEISCFCVLILLFGTWFYFIKKPSATQQKLLLLAWVLPLGYITMHIETRYIWLVAIITVLVAGSLVDEITNDKLSKITSLVFCISLIVYPLLHLEKMLNNGKDNFAIAEKLNNTEVRGTFISNDADAGKLWVIGYLSNNRNYTIENYNYTELDLEQELIRYKVDYYWHYAQNAVQKTQLHGQNVLYSYITQAGPYQIYKLEYLK